MTIFRVHFVIDLLGGLTFVLLGVRAAEKISWVFDAYIQGLPAHKRLLLFYDPCPSCGWANEHAVKLLDEEEKHLQAYV